MPEPLSKSAINKLGERLAKADVPSEEDLRLLEQVRAQYRVVMQRVEARINEALHVSISTRVKTVATLLEKLKRSRTRLATVQDIAGLRIVKDMTLVEQDRMVRDILAAFPGAEVMDRRAKPSQGYRAVHIVVSSDGWPAEVQVRTEHQHRWAQSFEELADQVGRGIRYAGPDAIVGDTVRHAGMRLLVLTQLTLSRVLHAYELAMVAETAAATVEAVSPASAVASALRGAVDAADAEFGQTCETIRQQHEQLRALIQRATTEAP